MVKKENKRVAITIDPATAKIADEIATMYGFTYTELFKWLVVDFHFSTLKKER